MKDPRKVIGPGGDRVHSKPCSRCKEVKEWTEFHSDQSKDDGLSSQCKECRSYRQSHNRQDNDKYIQWLRKELETQAPEVAKIIDMLLEEWQKAEPKLPELGFSLVVFDKTGNGVMVYAGNITKEKMIIAFEKFLQDLKQRGEND